MKKAIYSLGKSSEWFDVVNNFKKCLDWHPGYWITVRPNHQLVNDAFPGVPLHPYEDLARCIPAKGFESTEWRGLDDSILNEFVQVEQVAIEMMDRMELDRTFDYSERYRVYLWLLSYWLGVLKKIQPGVLIINTPPHSPSEYILFEVCRKRGVATRNYIPTQVGFYHFVSDRFDTLPKSLLDNYQKRLAAKNTHLSEYMQALLEEMVSEKGDKPWYIKDRECRDQKKENKKQRILKKINNGSLNIERLDLKDHIPIEKSDDDFESFEKNRQPIRRVLKKPGEPLNSALLTKGEYRGYLRWAFSKKVYLEKFYEGLSSSTFDTSRPYVFLALHFQPERTTCPDGGRFNNQLLAAAMIAHNLPDGWQLVIKEHPGQFSYHNTGEQSRSEQFYKDLASLPSTTLLSMKFETPRLRDQAKAVATVTGFIGWEALLAGIPVLVFGAAWYRECRGVHNVSSEKEIRKAFDIIVSGKTHTREEVVSYLGAVEDTGKVCFTNSSLSSKVDLNSSQIVDNLTSIMLDFQNNLEQSSF